MVTAYDSESGRPGSNPEWGPIYHEATITAHGLPEPLSLRGSIHWVPEQLNIKAVTGTCGLIDSSQPCAVFDHSFSGSRWFMPHI